MRYIYTLIIAQLLIVCSLFGQKNESVLFKAMQDEGFFTKNPGRDVPVLSLTQAKQGEHTNGYRFGRWTEIRDVYHEEVEKALQGKQTPKESLHNAQRRGNALLRAFERTAQ